MDAVNRTLLTAAAILADVLLIVFLTSAPFIRNAVKQTVGSGIFVEYYPGTVTGYQLVTAFEAGTPLTNTMIRVHHYPVSNRGF